MSDAEIHTDKEDTQVEGDDRVDKQGGRKEGEGGDKQQTLYPFIPVSLIGKARGSGFTLVLNRHPR